MNEKITQSIAEKGLTYPLSVRLCASSVQLCVLLGSGLSRLGLCESDDAALPPGAQGQDAPLIRRR
jgi:hypothetical protein